jgi:hypothetical protein
MGIFRSFVIGQAQGPLTARERISHAFGGTIVGLIIGVMLCCAFSTGPISWLWLYVVVSMLTCVIGAYAAPRWLIDVVASVLFLFTIPF